jgi:hypothetical protein
MRIAFIDHSYHHTTEATSFFVEILRRLGDVEIFFEESWLGRRAGWTCKFDSRAFDCIVIFQVPEAFQYIRWPHPNIVFIPMFDAIVGRESLFTGCFTNSKVVCFSKALHAIVSRHTRRTFSLQYYPDPRHYPVTNHAGRLRGIFWRRVPALDEKVIARLCERSDFDRFTLQDVPDPNSGAGAPPEASPIAARVLERTGWHADRREHIDLVSRHSVFFAPRPHEGIGMSMIEAMAMGLCVVAPDSATHNEYISHRKTGLLYDLQNFRPLHFGGVRELGLRARESVEKGYARWLAAQDALLDFIATPSTHLPRGRRE